MRKINFILAFLFSLSGVFAQSLKLPADTEFFYVYGGTNSDIARSIKETPDGGYIIAGTSSSFGHGDASIYLVKTDNNGKHLWSATYGEMQNDWGYSIEVTADSGYFVAGYSNSFNPPNGYDAYYFKTDKNGILQWQKIVSGTDWDFIYGSTPMPDGGFILCGETFTNSNGGSDAYLIRLNNIGDTIWTKHYGGLFDETFNSVTLINNQIYAAGKNLTHSIDTAADGWIVKLDTNGTVLKDVFITNAYTHFEEIICAIAPYTNGIFHFCGKVNQLDSNCTTSILGRADTSLTMSWVFMDGPTPPGNYEVFERIVNMSYGGICIIGTKLGGLGGHGMFFAGFDNGGGFINGFSPTDGGTQDDYGHDGIYTSSGRVIGVGSTQSTTEYCATPNLGLEDYFLIRYNSDSIRSTGVIPKYSCFADTLTLWVVGLKSLSNNGSVSLFPNPVYGIATLKIKGSQNEMLIAEIYSVIGEKLLGVAVDPNKDTEINFSGFSAGSYFLKLQGEKGNTISAIKFIVSN